MKYYESIQNIKYYIIIGCEHLKKTKLVLWDD